MMWIVLNEQCRCIADSDSIDRVAWPKSMRSRVAQDGRSRWRRTRRRRASFHIHLDICPTVCLIVRRVVRAAVLSRTTRVA